MEEPGACTFPLLQGTDVTAVTPPVQEGFLD